MLASEAATSPPQRPRVRVFFVGFGDSVVEHVDLCLLLLCGIVVLAGGVGNQRSRLPNNLLLAKYDCTVLNDAVDIFSRGGRSASASGGAPRRGGHRVQLREGIILTNIIILTITGHDTLKPLGT